MDDEIKEPLEKKEAEKKKRSPPQRFRWFTIILYPDNYYHFELLKYFNTCQELDFAYIRHQPETDEGKDHIHMLIRFPSPRTVKSVSESCGRTKAVKLDDGSYKVLVPGEFVPDYAVDVPIVGLPLVSGVNAPEAYYKYMTHSDFRSILEGKKQYDADDIIYHGDEKIFRRLGMSESIDRMSLYHELVSYANMSYTPNDMIKLLIADNRSDLLDFISGHSYFIKNFMFGK